MQELDCGAYHTFSYGEKILVDDKLLLEYTNMRSGQKNYTYEWDRPLYLKNGVTYTVGKDIAPGKFRVQRPPSYVEEIFFMTHRVGIEFVNDPWTPEIWLLQDYENLELREGQRIKIRYGDAVLIRKY